MRARENEDAEREAFIAYDPSPPAHMLKRLRYFLPGSLEKSSSVAPWKVSLALARVHCVLTSAAEAELRDYVPVNRQVFVNTPRAKVVGLILSEKYQHGCVCVTHARNARVSRSP